MPPRILIADDNAIFRKTLRHLLERVEHWEILEAEGGEEAVTKSVETRPDVIVLDLAMPDKHGLAAAQEISALLPDTPILMYTMHISRHVESEARRSGIQKVLSKSDSGSLLPTIRQLLKAEPPSSQSVAAETILPPVAPESSVAASISAAAPSESARDPVPPPSPKRVA